MIHHYNPAFQEKIGGMKSKEVKIAVVSVLGYVLF